MPISENQVRQGLQIADRSVRFAVLQYFADAFSPNTEVMRDAIEVIERDGTEAFEFLSPIAALAQTPDTIAWAVGKLQDADAAEGILEHHLSALISRADLSLATPFREQIVSAPLLDESCAIRLEHRLDLATKTPDQLWKRLDEICEECRDATYVGDFAMSEAEDVAEAISRNSAQADKVMELLSQDVDLSSTSSAAWREVLLVRMAGDLRLEQAIPLILKKFEADDDLLNEACERALRRIGSDAVIRALQAEFPHGPEQLRIYTAAVFRAIHTDPAISAGLELLRSDEQINAKEWLATALLDQFAVEAIEPARKLLLEHEVDDEPGLIGGVVAACKVTGYQIPEMTQWEQTLAEHRLKSDQARLRKQEFDDEEFDDEFDYSEDEPLDDEGYEGYQEEEDEYDDERSAPLISNKQAGRNDPCPCGSGKKYKKCCYGKQPLSASVDDATTSDAGQSVSSKPQYPLGTLIPYGPDDKRTTKIVAAVVRGPGAKTILERWVGTNVKQNPKVQRQIAEFFRRHGVKKVVATEDNFGCPHEEGPDFPIGEDCPLCPYWAGKQGSNRKD